MISVYFHIRGQKEVVNLCLRVSQLIGGRHVLFLSM